MSEGRTRGLMREVNATIRTIDASFGFAPGVFHLLCECGRDGCRERVDVPVAVYDEVLRTEQQFVVAVDHELPEGERVVGGNATYSVVAPRLTSVPRMRGALRIVGS